MHYNIAIVEDDPEIILHALHAERLDAKLFLGFLEYVVCDSGYSGGGIGIAHDKEVGDGGTYRPEVKRYYVLSLFVENCVRDDAKIMCYHKYNVILQLQIYKNITMHELPPIIWHKEIDSTNNEARRQLSAIDNLSVIAAEFQTAGRGQGDHIWSSMRGENLTFSVVLKFERGFMPARDALLITQVTTLALRRFLASKGIDSRIKWPNDIYVADMKKICGILIENVLTFESVTYSIIGIGLDVNQTQFSPDLPNPVSMKMLTGITYDTHALLEEFQAEIRDAVALLDTDEGRAVLDREFQSGVFYPDRG